MVKLSNKNVNDSFAYRPTASRGGMMRAGKESAEESMTEEESEESAVREMIRKEIRDLLQK